jgi:hypothetical protein
MGIVLASKGASESEGMFTGTPLETVCDTDVQNSVAISVGQNVNEVILMSH